MEGSLSMPHLIDELIEKFPLPFIIHRRGIIVHANDAATKLFCGPSGGLRGAKLLEMIHPEDKSTLIQYHRFLSQKASAPCEFRILGNDGGLRWIRFWAISLDKARGVFGIALDVTEERLAREEFCKRERFLESLFASIPYGISVLDPQMRIVQVNPVMERWYSHSMPIVGKRCYEAYHARSKPCDLCPVRETMETIEVRKAIVPLTGSKGETMGWLSLQSAPLLDVSTGELYGVIEYVEDVTERIKLEESLKDSMQLLSKAFTASSDWISITRLSDGKYLEVNEGYQKKTGYSREEVLGRTSLELGLWVNPSKRDEALRILRETGCLRDFEVDFRMRSAEVRTFSLAADVIEVRGEKCTLAICRDITERKALERQLALAQKMEAIGRLAGGIAHDFNNLLTVILGRVDLLLLKTETSEPSREPLEEIRKAANRAASLTRQLLAFSRKQTLESKLLDLNNIVSDMERMLSRLIGEDVEIVTVRDPDLWQVKLDPAQIEQVILNLAVNARDAMPKGGRLRIETKNHIVGYGDSMTLPPGHYVVLRVSDTGIGMDEEVRQRLFEPFFTTKEKGTGLGLATVYGIVTQSGGHIHVDSLPGAGTTFSIYFPAVEAGEAIGTTGEAPLTGTWSGTQTVLVAEDEDMVRRLICSVLRGRGYTVLEARNGLEAYQLARRYEGPIDLLITDIVMPGMVGQELSKKIKETRPGIQVLYISGYTHEALTARGGLEEGSYFLAKPFSPDLLARKVREVIGAQ